MHDHCNISDRYCWSKKIIDFGDGGGSVSRSFLGLVNGMDLSAKMMGLLSLFGLFGFIIFFAIGPGVVVWMAISELFPTTMRAKGISICLFFNSLASTILASVFLDLKNDIGMQYTYWLFAFFSFIYCLIAILFYRKPKLELWSKSRTYLK